MRIVSAPQIRQVALLLLLSFFALSVARPAAADKQEKMPKFNSKTVDGKTISLDDLTKDKPVLLFDFWALWCRDCLAFMPNLNDLKAKYKKDLIIVSVNGDTTQKASEVRSYVTGKKYDFTVLLEPENRLKNMMRVNFLPTLLVVSPDGVVISRHIGPNTSLKDILGKEIEDLIKARDAGKPKSDSSKPADKPTKSFPLGGAGPNN